jgi:hypothetical protein
MAFIPAHMGQRHSVHMALEREYSNQPCASYICATVNRHSLLGEESYGTGHTTHRQTTHKVWVCAIPE